MLVAREGPTMLARIRVIWALNRHRQPVARQRKKRAKKYRIVR